MDNGTYNSRRVEEGAPGLEIAPRTIALGAPELERATDGGLDLKRRARGFGATTSRDVASGKRTSSPPPICTARFVPDVALRSVLRSYDVYGPSVSLPGRKIV